MLTLATIAGVFTLAAHAITITTENESTAVGQIAAAIFSNDMSFVDNTIFFQEFRHTKKTKP